MRAILIDPTTETVDEIDAPIDGGDVRSLYPVLGVGNVEMRMLEQNGDLICVDGHGLLKPDPGPFFTITGCDQPLAGKGLLLGETQSGRLIAPRTSLRRARRWVRFPDIQLVGFEPFTGLDGHLNVVGSRAVFRTRK